MRTSESLKWFRIAAGAYALYGVVYMAGAIAELSDERKRDSFGFVPWWSYYLIGGLFVIVLPLLIARGTRWLAGVLGLLTAGRALYLFFGLGRGFSTFNLFFGLVALAAACLLLLAWGKASAKQQTGDDHRDEVGQTTD